MSRRQHTSTHGTSAQQPVQVDTTRLYRDAVGSEGVDAHELKTLAPELARVHRTVTENTHNELDAEFACLNLHSGMPESLPAIDAMAQALGRFPEVVVIGIGGSSLGAKAVYQALTAGAFDDDRPALHFLENIDPYHLQALLQRRRPESMAVICISKSGGTIETAVQYLILRDWLEKDLGKQKAREHQWIVTDPARGWLRDLAARENLPALPVPPKVGGRYSVLTAVGLLPLAAAGIDIRALLAGAAANAARCTSNDPRANPALEMAALFYLLDMKKNKRLSIMMPYVDPLQSFGDWYSQLWAESLGKRMTAQAGRMHAGTQPVRAMGTVDQHSQLQMYLESQRDKIFSFLALDAWECDQPIPLATEDRRYFPYLAGKRMSDVVEAEFEATRQVITDTGHPNMTLRLPALNAHALGQLIDLYQRTTVYTGLLYGINPLDQPAVEKGKILAIQHLSGGASA
ncbi:MAG: glucose-6-phosphate isomerase [Bacteroidota bacterium]